MYLATEEFVGIYWTPSLYSMSFSCKEELDSECLIYDWMYLRESLLFSHGSWDNIIHS